MTSVAPRDRGLLSEIERDVLSDKPVSAILLKIIILGGQAGSTALRDWASKELRGYYGDTDLPEYRRVPAIIALDGVTINAKITGQRIGRSQLPDLVKEHVKEQYEFRDGIDDIEALADQARRDGGSVRLSLPMGADLTQYMNAQSDVPYQSITSLYWQVSEPALRSVVNRVRTTLVELVSEMRAGTPVDQDVPSPEAASQAMSVAVYGSRSRVTVTSAQASGLSATSSVDLPRGAEAAAFWTTTRKIGAFVVGSATIAAAAIAAVQEFGWAFN